MQPLAERMRPTNLEDYIGQSHLLGPNAVLRKAIEAKRIPSFILWGPPGVGKTTLASIVSQYLKVPFQTLSAINSGVKDIREAIDNAARQRFLDGPRPILFIDEIHRFSKSQQDSLLGAVEKGIFTLIGATTENPSFEVIGALLSRCQVYVLKELEADSLKKMIDIALERDFYLKDKHLKITEYEAIIRYSGGDGRKLYNILELLAHLTPDQTNFAITNAWVETQLQEHIAMYDKDGEMHYDIASAFIKSMRGSDPDASIYWLARMLAGGEEINFIARRMVILASEDIGLANPNALLMAQTCQEAIKLIGMPEARIILAQTVVYLATSAKSNSTYVAINKALEAVAKEGNLPVPLHLRNAPTKLMKELNYGTNYQYAHNHEGNFVKQDFLPKKLKNTVFYEPGNNPSEAKIAENMKKKWEKE
jgi:putative ATPase